MSEFVPEESDSNKGLDPRSDIVIAPENVPQIAEMRSHFTEEMNLEITDFECLRFLIARKFDMKKAVEMLKTRYEWYNTPFTGYKMENPSLRPRDMLTNVSDDKDDVLGPLFPWAILSVDRVGHPVHFEKLGFFASNWPKIHKVVTEDELLVRHIRIVEQTQEMFRLQSMKIGYTISKIVVVQDFAKFPFFVEFSAFNFIQRMVKNDESYYPESLKKVLIINAPMYFTAVWSVVKPWLDPVTLAKVEIVGSNYLPSLLKVMAIEEIPVEYGGQKADVCWSSPNNTLLATDTFAEVLANKHNTTTTFSSTASAASIPTVDVETKETQTAS